MKILELVQDLNPLLTNVDHEKRLSGIEKLTKELTSMKPESLVIKEIETLTEFLCLRLTDHKSMVEPSLKCLSYFIDCPAKPGSYNGDLLDFLKTKVNIQRMEPMCRLIVYEMIAKILKEHRLTSSFIGSDLLYSLVHLIESESYPENILKCFQLVLYVMKNFEQLEPFLDDIFDWLGCYFPIDYTPKEDQESSTIQRSDLVEAIHECFYCNQLNAVPVLSLLVATFESTSVVAKIEALQCLIKAYEVFPLESLKDYTSTVWTSIRTQCLKKIKLMNQDILKLSYQVLSSMTKRLSEDDWLFKTFISDIYEELAIAFRKPEIELYEPSARLLVSAAKPKLSGFCYIMDKIIPVSLNALTANDLRPLSGLAYMFEQLIAYHPDPRFPSDLQEQINKLTNSLVNVLEKDSDAIRLLRAIIRSKIQIQAPTLDLIVEKLFRLVNCNSMIEIVEDCLVSLYNNGRHDILFDTDHQSQSHTEPLIDLIGFYDKSSDESDAIEPSISTRLNLYLHQIITQLDTLDFQSNQAPEPNKFATFLSKTRDLALKHQDKERIVIKIAKLHGIIINKLRTDHVQEIVMKLFTSDFCQKIASSDPISQQISQKVYLPIVSWSMKALVIRNHKLFEPMVNLLLNCVTSDLITRRDLSLTAAKSFSFVLQDTNGFDSQQGYNVFHYYKQKLFSQSLKEVKLRCDKMISSTNEETKRRLLLCSVSFQLVHLRPEIYKHEIQWLMRELLISLNKLKSEKLEGDSSMANLLIESIIGCITREVASQLSPLSKTLSDSCLYYAKEGEKLETRKLAINCLLKMTVSFDDSDLLFLRQSVVSGLRDCLADKKRLVREIAGEARLRWTLIGEPIG